MIEGFKPFEIGWKRSDPPVRRRASTYRGARRNRARKIRPLRRELQRFPDVKHDDAVGPIEDR